MTVIICQTQDDLERLQAAYDKMNEEYLELPWISQRTPEQQARADELCEMMKPISAAMQAFNQPAMDRVLGQLDAD